jgi:hypothetical protein
MIQATRLLVVFVCGIAGCLSVPISAHAETWSDKSGSQKIEAEYVGVEGRNVVLRKPDGKIARVRIDKLSDESRAQAKRLYEKEKSGAASSAAPAPPAASSAPSSQPKFTPPSPPTTPPMAAFPENASLQDTVNFLRSQLMAGHPEIVWYALPQDMRETLDSAEFRDSLTPMFDDQAQNRESMEKVAMKLVEVLVTKKQFALNSPLMKQFPPPMIEPAYDPAVGLIYEMSRLLFGTDSLSDKTITELVDYHGPRIGAHFATLAKATPPGMIDGVLDRAAVEQSGDDTGTISVPNNQGGTDTTEMVRYMGRWIPRDLAEKWSANKSDFTRDVAAQLTAARAQDPQAVQQANMMIAGWT